MPCRAAEPRRVRQAAVGRVGRGWAQLHPRADALEHVEMVGPQRAVQEAQQVNLMFAGRRLEQPKVPEARPGIQRVRHARREKKQLHERRGYQGTRL